MHVRCGVSLCLLLPPPAPRRRPPPQEEGVGAEEGGVAPLEEAPPPSPEFPVAEGNPWERRVKRRSERSSEPTHHSPVGVVLRCVSRSASPSDKGEGVCLRSRTPSPEPSPERGDLARARRGEAAPSRPEASTKPEVTPIDVDCQSGSEHVESSEEERVNKDGGEPSPSKVEAAHQAKIRQRLMQAGQCQCPYSACCSRTSRLVTPMCRIPLSLDSKGKSLSLSGIISRPFVRIFPGFLSPMLHCKRKARLSSARFTNLLATARTGRPLPERAVMRFSR